MTAGLGATFLGLVVVAWATWLRSDQGVTRAPTTSESTVMLGDSITEQGPWDAPFPTRSIVNRGYSGFTTAQLVDVASEIAPAQPRAVYVLTGANDIRDDRPPAWTVRHLAALLDELASAAPDTTVLIQTILPRQDRANEVRATNQAITQLAADRGIEVVDLHAAFDNGFGGLRPEDSVDGIHLSETGNRRWANVLREDFARR